MSSDGGSGETRVEAGGDGAAINIRCSNGSKFTVRTRLDLTVGAFKAVLVQNCDVPADHQRLIYKGRILKDNDTLESYGKLFLIICGVAFFCLGFDSLRAQGVTSVTSFDQWNQIENEI